MLFLAYNIFAVSPAIFPVVINTILKNSTYEKELCVQIEYFIDQDRYFIYTFLHVLFSIYIMYLISACLGGLFIITTYHIIGEFNVVGWVFNLRGCNYVWIPNFNQAQNWLNFERFAQWLTPRKTLSERRTYRALFWRVHPAFRQYFFSECR